MKNLFNFNYRFNPATVEFNNAIWFFGCSNVYGYHLADHETAPALLESLTGIPVINLGINGGNVFNIKHNLVELLRTHTPTAIVIAWTNPSRWMDSNKFNWGPWFLPEGIKVHPENKTVILNEDRFNEYVAILSSGKLLSMTNDIMQEVREIIKDYPNVEFIYTPMRTMPTIHIDKKIDMIDFATQAFPDKTIPHPGPATNMRVAEWISSEFKILNVTNVG
jgi:hypothetical protein